MYPQEIKIRQPVAFFSMMHNDAKQFTCLFSFIRCPTLFEGVYFIEGSLEIKRPTIWTDGIAEAGRVREEKKRREKIREEKE